MDYIKQAQKFCEKYNTIIEAEFLKTDKYFEDDIEKRDIYNIIIKRGDKTYRFQYGDSIINTQKNKNKNIEIKLYEYDILSCLTKYEVGDFDDFIADYGYTFSNEREYIKVKQIYFKVVDEYKNVYNIFSDCIEELREIY